MSDIPWPAILGTFVTMSGTISGGIVLAAKKFIAFQEQSAVHERDMEKLRHDRNSRLTDSLIETSGTLKDVQVIQANVASALTQTTARLTDVVADLTGAESARCASCERANMGSGEMLIAIKAVGEQIDDLGREMGDSYGSLITILSIPNKR